MPCKRSITIRLFKLAIPGPLDLQLAEVSNGYRLMKLSATKGCFSTNWCNPCVTALWECGDKSNIGWGSAAKSPLTNTFKGVGLMFSGRVNSCCPSRASNQQCKPEHGFVERLRHQIN